jgi:ribosomal protein S21
LSGSEGSDVDEKEKRRRRNLKLRNNAKKIPLDPAIAAVTGTASTSGMKRIPKLSDRNRGNVPLQPQERSRSPYDDVRGTSRDRFRESERSGPMVASFDRQSSESGDEDESRKRRGYDEPETSMKRRKLESGRSRLSSVSSSRSMSPHPRKKTITDKFVMEISEKVSLESVVDLKDMLIINIVFFI